MELSTGHWRTGYGAGLVGTRRWMIEMGVHKWGWVEERKKDDGVRGQVIMLGSGYWREQVGGSPNLTKMGTPVSES